MELDAVMQAISTVGFPIACFLLMWKRSGEQADKHKEEVQHMTKALENNTLAIQHLSDTLNYDGGAKH